MTTLLKETKNEKYPFGIEYSIICGSQDSGGGVQSNVVEAQVLDNHYLLLNRDTIHNHTRTPIAIIDIGCEQEGRDRMYKEALKIAKQRARNDRDSFSDLTSRVEQTEVRYHTIT